MSDSNCWLLISILVSQETGKVFPSFSELSTVCVIHTVKGSGVVNKAEVDAFLKFSCFSYDPMDVGNLLSGSSAFSKWSLNIWKLRVHTLLKPGLENFEHYFASVWDEWKLCGSLSILWHCLSLGLEWKLIFSSPVATAEFSKFAGILSAAAAKSLQSCPTLRDPIDGLLPGSSVPGILQARTLEWVAISFSNAWKWKVKVKSLSCARLFTTPWTAAHQAPPSMGFSRQEYWSGVPLQHFNSTPPQSTHKSSSQRSRRGHLCTLPQLWLTQSLIQGLDSQLQKQPQKTGQASLSCRQPSLQP